MLAEQRSTMHHEASQTLGSAYLKVRRFQTLCSWWYYISISIYIYECYYINNPKGDCWHSERFHHQLPCVLDIESRRIHSIRRKASNSQGSRHHWNHSQIRTHLRHIVERNGQRTIDNYWYQMTMTFVCLPLEIGGSHFLYASTFFLAGQNTQHPDINTIPSPLRSQKSLEMSSWWNVVEPQNHCFSQ